MKLFKTIKPSSIVEESEPDVQAAPVGLSGQEKKRSGFIKVDVAYRNESHILIAGWASVDVEVGLSSQGIALEVQQLRLARPDVAQQLDLVPDELLGFALLAEYGGSAPVVLSWRQQEGKNRISKSLLFASGSTISLSDQAALGTALSLLALTLSPHTPKWLELITYIPIVPAPRCYAKGYLEGAAFDENTGCGVVFGWIVRMPGVQIWLEDDTGQTYTLENAFYRWRQDVHDEVGYVYDHAKPESGFIAYMRGGKPGSKLELKCLSETGVHVLSETQCATLPANPVDAARWLYGVYTPMDEMHQRIPLVDGLVHTSLAQGQQEGWNELPVRVKSWGRPVQQPIVSIIVPLYGRTDFVEHQLIEFCQDPWLAEHAELIYVLDDPRLLEFFPMEAEAWHRLYGMPFTWVWGGVNRGFSAANNLGAKHAHGEYLLFLNSDAFPQQHGWILPLLEVLQQRSDIGAVGPRLVFADGSIQHAGMQFVRVHLQNYWFNHHPYMGLDPMLDPHKELTIVPAITGACLAMRRIDFDSVNGWDTGYLIGDFEDSDLCLKLRSLGLQAAYLPTVQLTHLERQSFRMLGQEGFRRYATYLNAVRHQTRWGHLLGAPADAIATA